MRIKSPPKVNRKQKAYLKWMGLLPPKTKGRLAQLNKHNRKSRNVRSEFLTLADVYAKAGAS